jgi:4-aminobutyrate aminotransferase-like enzyme
VLKLLPPLTIDDAALHQGLDALGAALAEVLGGAS